MTEKGDPYQHWNTQEQRLTSSLDSR
jgi:hypothetical protein